MKVALAQIKTSIGDLDANAAKITEFCVKAKELGAELIVFPEMSLSGYPLKKTILQTGFTESVIAKLDDLVTKLPEINCILGFVDKNPLSEGRPYYNAAALIQNKELSYISYKSSVPRYDFYDQSEYFEPASAPTIVKCGQKKIAITINEDLLPESLWSTRVSEQRDFFQEVAKKKPDLIVNLCAQPYTFGADKLRINLIKQGAAKYGIPVVVANMVGGQDELVFDGTSFCVDAKGEVIARAKSYHEDIVFIDLDYGAGDIHDEQKSDEQMSYEALVLGTRDYLKKYNYKKAIVSLNEDASSSLVLSAAVDAIGAENVVAILTQGSSANPTADNRLAFAQGKQVKTAVVNAGKVIESLVSCINSGFKDADMNSSSEKLLEGTSATVIASVADKLGGAVLSSITKSDHSIGHQDTYSHLSILSDLPKTSVYNMISKVINRDSELVSIPANVAAEYTKLDNILNSYQCENKSVEEIEKQGIDKNTVLDVIRKIKPCAKAPACIRISTKLFNKTSETISNITQT